MFGDPVEVVECLARWLWRSLAVVALPTLLLGILSVVAPQQSIALYQWIMARCNWRVEPINAAHELRTTRLLGVLLIGLSVVLVWFLIAGTGWADEQKGTGQMAANRQLATATFAGGCFWCMEPPFSKLPGVISVMPGYTGGTQPNPTYEEVSSGTTGHAEAVQILYDPSAVSYETLLETFWRNIDPTQADGQFADRGSQYRTAIFTHTAEQQRLALESQAALERSGTFGKPIVTQIVPAGTFYPAEDYHREYYKKNPTRYQLYKAGSGREGYLKRTWGEAEEPKGR